MKKHKKGNKVIAEFMGIKYKDGSHDSLYKIFPKQPEYTQEIKYHTSWDWLMPVLSKIRNDTPFFVNKAKEYTGNIEYALKTVSMDYLYGAIVDFIEWYNKEGAEQIRKDNERRAGHLKDIEKRLEKRDGKEKN